MLGTPPASRMLLVIKKFIKLDASFTLVWLLFIAAAVPGKPFQE